jgi:putative endonuclease
MTKIVDKGKDQSALDKGKHGENIAVEYFLNSGYKLESRNYRYRRGEIDLILKKENLLLFVEVKFRKSDKFGFPEEFVTENQKQSIIRTADHYIHQHCWGGNIRFDIIAINDRNRIDHFEDAFY